MTRFPSYDYAVHSDFLIHWTGKDIDFDHQPKWYEGDHYSKTPEDITKRYLERLKNILRYGLWMTEEAVEPFKAGASTVSIPPTPMCCFTELKLSESRRHAALYGRLGIGVKRGFLFERFGRPLAYFGWNKKIVRDRFLEACSSDLRDRSLLNFFKPMNADDGSYKYQLYSESEWRILFCEELLREKKIIDPRDSKNAREHAYFKNLTADEQKRLRYLLPLDGWFSALIYPSLIVKNGAQQDSRHGIAAEIQRIKSAPDHPNRVEGGNRPIEIDLDACRNF